MFARPRQVEGGTGRSEAVWSLGKKITSSPKRHHIFVENIASSSTIEESEYRQLQDGTTRSTHSSAARVGAAVSAHRLRLCCTAKSH